MWCKKKRSWLLGVVGVVAVAAVAGNSGSNEQAATSLQSDGGQAQRGIIQGIGSQDASADLVDLDCGAPASTGVTYPKVRVKTSSKPSDYFATVVAQSSDGSIKV